MPKKSPLAQVNETFGGKDKLVEKLLALVETDETKEEMRKRLLAAANSKLLHLHEVASMVKENYGSRDKLVTAAAAALGRSKDKHYLAKLETFSTAKLIDVTISAERRAKRAAEKNRRTGKAATAQAAK
jgi:galactokinase